MAKGFLVSVIMIWSVRRQNYRKEHFKSSPYFYSKKYLKHFITELVEGRTQSEGETKSSHNDSTHSEALSQLGALGGGLSPEGVWRDIFELPAKAGSQGLAWAPCPGQPPFWAPFTRAPSGRPSCARSARWSAAKSPRLLWATEWAES